MQWSTTLVSYTSSPGLDSDAFLESKSQRVCVSVRWLVGWLVSTRTPQLVN
jgi:hypothetical protein